MHIMKMITAVVRPFKLDELRQAIAQLGVQGVTVTEVYEAQFGPRAKVEIAVDDAIVEPVLEAIANEAGIEGVHIGRVDIREDHSFVDLPEGMPNQIFKELQKVRVAGRELRISRVDEKPPKPPRDTTGRHPSDRPAERKMLSRRKAKH